MPDSHGRATRLTEAEIDAAFAQLDGWDLAEASIVKGFTLASFAEAIEFVVRVAGLAERADHHPDIDIRWRTVHIALTTHDCAGLSGRDFDLAVQIEEASR